jgi:hypothetical protein
MRTSRISDGASDGLPFCGAADDAEPSLLGRHAVQPAGDVAHGPGHPLCGGITRAAALAIVGSLVGEILGTALPVPIVGTLIGASLGAFIGSLLGDLWAGRPLLPSVEAGWGGRGPVLRDGVQADRRRHHRGRSGADCALLMENPEVQSTLTFAGIDAAEKLPFWHGSTPPLVSLALILLYGRREWSRRPWKISWAIPTTSSMSSLARPLQSPINSIRAS